KPIAARLLGKARSAMRLLYARNADADDRAAARKSQPRPGNHPAAPQRQYLPLHRLRGHHQLGRARGRIDARGKGSALMAEAGKIHSPPAGRQQEPADQRLNVIGTRILRKEDPRFLVGRGRFVDDVALPNMAHAAVLRSPHAHARIKSIDKRAALALPGVAAVITGEEAAQETGPLPCFANPPVEQRCIALGKVRHVGEPVVLVVADSRYVAEDAAALIKVEYELLP